MNLKFFILFILLFHSPAYAAQEYFPFLGEITADKVQVRAGQHQNFEPIGTVNKGEEVVVVGKNFSWYKIKLPPQAESYISANYVEYLRDDIAQVKGTRVNVRAGKDTKFSILGQADKGQLVKVTERFLDWYKIEPLDNTCGWVSEDYLKFKSKEVPAARTVELPTLNIYKRKQMLEQQQATQEPQKAEQPVTEDQSAGRITISAIGQVENLEGNANLKETSFQLVVNGQTAYLLEGPVSILEPFQHLKVKIDGYISSQTDLSNQYPVVFVTKIDLVL